MVETFKGVRIVETTEADVVITPEAAQRLGWTQGITEGKLAQTTGFRTTYGSDRYYVYNRLGQGGIVTISDIETASNVSGYISGAPERLSQPTPAEIQAKASLLPELRDRPVGTTQSPLAAPASFMPIPETEKRLAHGIRERIKQTPLGEREVTISREVDFPHLRATFLGGAGTGNQGLPANFLDIVSKDVYGQTSVTAQPPQPRQFTPKPVFTDTEISKLQPIPFLSKKQSLPIQLELGGAIVGAGTTGYAVLKGGKETVVGIYEKGAKGDVVSVGQEIANVIAGTILFPLSIPFQAQKSLGEGKGIGFTLGEASTAGLLSLQGLKGVSRGGVSRLKPVSKVPIERLDFSISEQLQSKVGFRKPTITRRKVSIPEPEQISAQLLDLKAIQTGETRAAFGVERATFDIVAQVGFKTGKKSVIKTITGKSELQPILKTGVVESETVAGRLGLKRFIEEPSPQKLARTQTILQTDIRGKPVIAATRGTFAEMGHIAGVVAGEIRGKKIKPITFVGSGAAVKYGQIVKGARKTAVSITGAVGFGEQAGKRFGGIAIGKQAITLRKMQKLNKEFMQGADLRFRLRQIPRTKTIQAIETQVFAEALKKEVAPELKTTKMVTRSLGFDVKQAVQKPVVARISPRPAPQRLQPAFVGVSRQVGFGQQIKYPAQRKISGFDVLSSAQFQTPKTIPKELQRVSDKQLTRQLQDANTISRNLLGFQTVTSQAQNNNQIQRQLVGQRLAQRQLTRQRQETLQVTKTATSSIFAFPFGFGFAGSQIRPIKTTFREGIKPIRMFKARFIRPVSRYRPSLYGIALGARIKKTPKFVAGGTFGIRPIVLPTRRSAIPQVPKRQNRMKLINDLAVHLGGKKPMPAINPMSEFRNYPKTSKKLNKVLGFSVSKRTGKQRRRKGAANLL